MLAAIAQLIAVIWHTVQWISRLTSGGQFVGGMGTVILDMTVSLFAPIMLTVFLFALAVKQKN
jgi:hypothetical protein